MAKAMDVKGDMIFLIYSKKRNQVLYDKMTHKPFFNINRKVMDQVAREYGDDGEVMTANEAIKKILREGEARAKRRSHR
jgi:hypothetical protein